MKVEVGDEIDCKYTLYYDWRAAESKVIEKDYSEIEEGLIEFIDNLSQKDVRRYIDEKVVPFFNGVKSVVEDLENEQITLVKDFAKQITSSSINIAKTIALGFNQIS